MNFYKIFFNKKYHIFIPFIISFFTIFFLKLTTNDYFKNKMADSYELSGSLGLAEIDNDKIFIIRSFGSEIFPNYINFQNIDLKLQSIIFSEICKENSASVRVRTPIIDRIKLDHDSSEGIILFKLFFTSKDNVETCVQFLEKKFIDRINLYIINKLIDYKSYIIEALDKNTKNNDKPIFQKDLQKNYKINILLKKDIQLSMDWNYLMLKSKITKIENTNVNYIFYSIWIIIFVILILLFNRQKIFTKFK